MNKLILAADYILTMAPDLRVLTKGALLVEEGRIADLGDVDLLKQRHPGAPLRHLANRLIMPGLINAHCHSGLLRGTAEGLPVWEWLRRYIDPMHRVLQPREAEIASRLCYAEALLSGTTTLVDMWRFMDGSARAARDLGLRALLVPYVAEHPEHNYFETLDSNEAMIQNWHGKEDDRIRVWVGLEHMFYAVPEAWKRAIEMTHRYKVGFHTHSNESQFDIQESLRRYGVRPVEALERNGLLDGYRTVLAHGVWLSDEEIDILARKNVGIAHNPVSNMKLASGAAPFEKLLKKGINVGLGTDGEKENNNLDMFEELKGASLLTKLSTLNAASVDSWDVLRCGTLLGARAFGWDDQIGSLEIGKRADLIAVRTDTPRMTPLLGHGDFFNLHHNLVHAVRGGDVDLTMVDGQILVEDGQLKSADLAGLIKDVNEAVPGLFQRRAEWLARSEGSKSPIHYEAV
jgi:5-methylthioadenosine/S-adenosylhomocysteine deaminase